MSLLTLGGARVRQAWLLARFASLLVLATLFSTCELFTSPGEQQDIVVDFEGDTILVVGRAISTAVTVTIGGTEVLQPRLQFISSDTTVVVVRANGDSLFAKRRGEVDLTIQLVGSTLSENPPSATLRLYVYAAGIQVDQRSHVFNSLNESIIFVAEALDADGAVITGAPIVWASSDDAVASVEDNGRVTSRLNGTATLTAAVGGDVSSGGNPVSITVEIEVAQRLVRYSFEPATVRLEGLGAQVRVTLTPRDSGGSAIPSAEAPAASFESLDQTRATVDNTGLVTAIANGATKVRAFAVLVSDSVEVEVQQRAKTVLINGLDTRTITSVGDSTALSAVAIDSLGNVLTNPSISWVSRDIARIQVAPRPPTNVTLQSFSLGSAWVVASQDQGRDSVLVSISNDPVRLEVTPDTVRFENVGDLVQFTGTARNGIGTALPGQTVLWTVLDPTIVSIVGTGAATAEGVGSTRVIGRLTGTTIVDTAHITVNNLPSTVDLALQAVSLASVGDTSIPVVDIRNARGVALSRSAVRWETTGSQIATVSTDGIVVATGAGSAYIKAINPLNEARRDSLLLTVTNAPASVTLTPENFTITSLTRTQQYTATAFNARGSITTAVPMQFLSTRPQFATIDPVTGLATAVAVGLDTIIATAGGRADTAVLTIQNDAKDVVVSPPTAVVSSVGATFQLVAVARNDLGAQIPGVAFTWTSSDDNVATVTNTGLVEGVTVGAVTITATLGTLTAISSVTVANDPDVVDFALPSVTLASVGDAVMPAITLENAVGDPLPRTAATWTTDNGLIATVNATGNIVAVARGTTTIRATSPSNASRTDAITVVVTNAPVTVDVQPDAATLPSIGRTVALSIIARNAAGGLITGDGIVWQSLNPGIASVNSAGVVTAQGIGTAQIVGTDTATGATTNDISTITVSNLTATAAIEPTSVSLTSIGQTRRIHVRARNELGNVITLDNILVGAPVEPGEVTWSVLPAGIVSIVQDAPLGQDTITVTALAAGSATITALVDGVSVSIPVSVGDEPTLVDITSANFTLASLDDFQDVAINVRNALNVALLPSAVTWTTSDPNVATVNTTGRVTARARGTTLIRAASPLNALLFDQITVTVSNAPVTVVLSNGDLTLDTTLTAVGRTLNYIATVRNAAGALIPGDSVRWASSVPGVAGVAPTGRQAATVTALAAGGPAAITGQVIVGAFGGYAGTNLTSPTASQVTVTNAATSLNLAPVVDTITNLGGTLQLTATALNDFGVVLPSTSVAFGFVGAAVTSVSATGLVTATNVAGNIGTAQVTASVNAGAIVRTSFITVVNAPTVLNVIPVNRTLASVGDTAFPAVTIQNAGGAALPRTAVVWSSTAPNVALVTETGEVTTVGEGTTTIRATSPFNPTVTDAYTVTVTNDPASIVLNQTTAVALSALGRTFAFTGVVRNARGDALTGHSITWSRQTGAAVNLAIPDGVVTAAAIGTSTIRAAVTGFLAVLDEADVTVTNATVAINLNPASLTLTSLGQPQLVTATALNDLGAATGAAITWAPVTTIVTGVPGAPTAVSPTLTANQVGTVTVTATVGAVVAQLPVTVRNDVTNIDITTVGTQGAPLVVELADSNFLGVALQNGLGGAITDRRAVTWTSSNPAVASVADTGLVTGVGAGTAIIRAISPTNPALPGRDSIFVSVPNTAATVTLDATAPVDTFTAVGQFLTYTATVRNAFGAVIPGASVTWTSDDGSIGVPGGATPTATITALSGSGSATVTATSGAASIDIEVVVVDPDTLFVDKDAAVTSRFGTRKRPYQRIEDALDAAASLAPDKVVFIRRGSTAYAETLTLDFNITLSGDSTAAGCANNTHCTTPASLPTLAHLSGAAAITLAAGTDVTIRHLAIRHAVDGPAIDATGARLTAEFVHVNPDPVLPATPTGRGILIRNTTDSSLVRLSGINRVRTYGIRFDNATDGGAVDTVRVTDVDSLGGTDGRSGLHLLNSTRIHTAGNRFTQTGGAPTTMDGIRAAGSRAIAVGTDTFTNGRFSLRTSNGTVTTTGIRSINAVMAYYVAGTTDTLTATGDSVTNATGPCLTVFAGGTPPDTVQIENARGCNDTTDDTQVLLTIRLVDASGTPIVGSFVTFTSDDPDDDLGAGAGTPIDLDTQANGIVTVAVDMTAGALGQRVIRMESRGQAGDEDFGVVVFLVVKTP